MSSAVVCGVSGVVTSVVMACSVCGSGSILSSAVMFSTWGWCAMVVTSSWWFLVAFWFWGLFWAVFSRWPVFWMLAASRGWVPSGAAAVWWFISVSGCSVPAWAAAGWWGCSPWRLRSVWGLWPSGAFVAGRWGPRWWGWCSSGFVRSFGFVLSSFWCFVAVLLLVLLGGCSVFAFGGRFPVSFVVSIAGVFSLFLVWGYHDCSMWGGFSFLFLVAVVRLSVHWHIRWSLGVLVSALIASFTVSIGKESASGGHLFHSFWSGVCVLAGFSSVTVFFLGFFGYCFDDFCCLGDVLLVSCDGKSSCVVVCLGGIDFYSIYVLGMCHLACMGLGIGGLSHQSCMSLHIGTNNIVGGSIICLVYILTHRWGSVSVFPVNK